MQIYIHTEIHTYNSMLYGNKKILNKPELKCFSDPRLLKDIVRNILIYCHQLED